MQCTAIDQDNMRAVLGSVSDIVLRGNIQAAVSMLISVFSVLSAADCTLLPF